MSQYSGVVTTIGDPELGQNGKERPRKIVLKQDLSEQYGKTFRLFAWKDDFQKLRMGQRVTVEYVEKPNPDPTRRPSNEITAVYVDDGEGSDGGGTAPLNGGSSGSTSPAAAGTPPPSDTSSWGQMPADTWSTSQAGSLSKDDYWERKEAKDEERTREIESAWAIGLLINNVPADQLHQEVHRLIVFKHQVARELADG